MNFQRYADPNNWTWGYELELGDIPRDVPLPEHLGEWEFCENEILNLRHPYQGIANDPYGKNPPMGGEINVKPTYTKEQLLSRLVEIFDYFRGLGHEPTVALLQAGHTHVRIRGLDEDIEALKHWTSYVLKNQKDFARHLHGFRKTSGMTGTIATKMKGPSRPMPEWMGENIIKNATDFDSFIEYHMRGRDGKTVVRPTRYTINTYNMKHTRTIEFRAPRASVDPVQLGDTFEFISNIIQAAFTDGRSVDSIYRSRKWNFAPFRFSQEHWDAWSATCQERGSKRRRFFELERP